MDFSRVTNFLAVNRVARIATWIVGIGAVVGLSGFLGVLAVVYSMVYFGDDSLLKKSSILARINEETTLYMLDEETKIGSIFDTTHRTYTAIDEVPAHMINALIASEDKNFYNHNGVDPVAMVNAGFTYLSGGRMRGASTLTQQTVRNILGWWEVTLSRKFREWIAALQLERQYTKREILEFYLNQFYVSGNGNGIGIAAKYYFNKEVRDLDLVESAFIAGSVKGPSAYDPFIKFTKERRERAIKNAYYRKNYVIKRMYEQGWITEEEFKESWDKPVKFNRGRFRSEEVALVHVIRQQLEKKEILEALNIEDPRELTSAGLKIYTTIDAPLQEAGQLAMRRNLSRLDTILKGFKPEKEEFFKKIRTLLVNDFYYGQVVEIGGTEKEPIIRLNFGLPNGTIPYESLMRYAKWIDLPWGQGWQKQLKTMLGKIKVGDILYVEVKEYDPETHEAVLEMHKRPIVNGGMIALDKGEVRAVVSGFDTKGFNRAMQAKRQPGSVFKPVVYFAALQLGWSILDRLDNERQVFPFQGRFYYPRADHDTPYKETSLLWSGVTSENLASVALAARLVEKLNFEQFRQLMSVMELTPTPGEAPRDFHYRVARKIGVQLDNDGVKEYQLTNAVQDLLLDVSYTTTFDYQQRLKKMWWGRGYASEVQNIYANDGEEISARNKAVKLQLAFNNFTRLAQLDAQLVNDWQAIDTQISEKGAEQAFNDPGIQHLFERFRVLPGLSKPALGYATRLETERSPSNYVHRSEVERLLTPPGRSLNALDLQAIWGGSALFGSADLTLTDVQLDGWLPHGHFVLLSQYIDRHYEEIMARQEDYDLHRYWQHHDFRIGIGLNYLVQLAQAMGVTSKIEPVLSFPLGTNDVTIAEVAKIYQTFISGKTYRFYDNGPANQINFIRRIEDRFGNPLFAPEVKVNQLVMPEFGLQMREILRRVVTHGTGRTARAELYLTVEPGQAAANGKRATAEKKVRIPAYGKTGTTNDYTNANFAGFMPYPTAKGEPLDPENSYIIASYAGYDMNKTMQNGFLKISGGLGALPAWIGLAKGMIDKKKYMDSLDPLDINVISQQEWPLVTDKRSTPLNVDMPRGVILNRGGGADQEAIAMSDSSKEGESAFDEYRATVVQTTVRMPLDSSGAPLRIFSPFKAEARDKDNDVKPSKVEVGPGPSAPAPGNKTGQTSPGGGLEATTAATVQARAALAPPGAATTSAPADDEPIVVPAGGSGVIEADLTGNMDGPANTATPAAPATLPAPTSDDVFEGMSDDPADASPAVEKTGGDEDLW